MILLKIIDILGCEVGKYGAGCTPCFGCSTCDIDFGCRKCFKHMFCKIGIFYVYENTL